MDNNDNFNNSENVSNFSDKELEIIQRYKEAKKHSTTQGMQKTAQKGSVVSRAPFGYKIENKQLVPADNADEVEDIFNEFLSEQISLNKLATRHKLTVNGLKKVLSNFSYTGKVKFNGQIYPGVHTPLISNTLFNHVQNKLHSILKKQT